MAYQINWHFQDPTTFNNGWQLLWQGKANQDIATKERNMLYKKLIKELKPQMIADGRKANKSNTFYYSDTEIYKKIHACIDTINKNLKEDNDETRKYIDILKSTGEY